MKGLGVQCVKCYCSKTFITYADDTHLQYIIVSRINYNACY